MTDKEKCPDCGWVENEGGKSCLAKNPKGSGYCTLPKGHSSEHVACLDDKEHSQKVWKV